MSKSPGEEAAPEAWQIAVPCTRAQAEMFASGEFTLPGDGEPPAVVASEPDPSRPDDWRVDIIFDHEPLKSEIDELLDMVPGIKRKAIRVEPILPADWVTQSQAGLAPISAGPFHVRHDATEKPAKGAIDFLIPASRAFGTGAHETTRGCLEMLGRLRNGGARFGNVADIGTGTGLLAFAANALWPRAHSIASDIDPASIEVTAENAGLNAVPLGAGPGSVLLVTAAGVDHPLIRGLAPYDLVIANILAGPLIDMAPALCAQIAEGGSLILAGLLAKQEGPLRAAYRAQGMRLADRIDHGDWPALHLRKRRRFGWRRPPRWRDDDDGFTTDFGSW